MGDGLRVIYPYVREFPEALAALGQRRVEKVDVGSGDQAYWRLMRDLWRSGDDFLIVEQDMVVPSGAVAAFETCPREWCGQPYFMYRTWGCWHGVVRYRGSLTRSLPDLPDQIAQRHWQSLDSAWINHLRLAGRNEAHWHWPPARHLSPRHAAPSGVTCPNCGHDVTLTVGKAIADLTGDDALTRYRASLRLSMTDSVL